MSIALQTAAFRPQETPLAPKRSSNSRVGDLLVEACRNATEDLSPVEIVVDCDPVHLILDEVEARSLTRCADLLLESALAARPVSEINCSARAAGTVDSPLLLLSVRTFAIGSSRRELPAAWAASGPVRIARLNAKSAANLLLVSHRDSFESRFSLGLEMAFRLEPRRQAPMIDPLESKVLVADGNPRARRAYRRLLESEGYTVREAIRPLELIAQLDPDETVGVPPAWLLLDREWIGSSARGRQGLVELVEASLPPERVLLLESIRGGGEPGPAPEGWSSLEKPFTRAALRERLCSPGPLGYLRKSAAEMPYSLSL